MKSIIVLCCLIFFSNYAFSQSSKIFGIVRDTSTNTNITNATVYLLRFKDSIIIDYVRTTDGKFVINKIIDDSVFILISYPSYADYSEKLYMIPGQDIYLNIPLTNKIKLLEEIVIKGKVSLIKIKGDTTEYNAEAFNLPPNATAQELLKKLPGLQVTKNGQIIAQGEKVTRIFVDGEEFFSSDPSLVTQNLNADMISKVQVFNQSSELSKLMGVKDGNTSKAINIKLKEDRKKGYFGKINLSAGNNDYYNQKFFFNYFEGKKKIALFGDFSSNGNYNSNEEPQVFFNNSLIDLNNNVGQIDSWSGNFEGRGRPYAFLGGFHYNDNFDNDRNAFSLDYRTQRLSLKGIDSTTTSYNLAEDKNLIKEKRNFSNFSFRHSLEGKLESQLDSSLSFKLNFSAQTIDKQSDYFFQNKTFTDKEKQVNSENRTLNFSGGLKSLNSSLNIIKKTKKPRRNILLLLNQSSKNDISDGFLYSDQLYFTPISINSQITDQFKTNQYKSNGVTTKITYTEPVSSKAFLLFNLEYSSASSQSNIKSFEKSSNGKYDSLDSLYSSNLDYNLNLIKGELGYTLIKPKYYLISSLGFGITKSSQSTHNPKNKINNNFKNIYPSILFSYKLGVGKRITFNYDGLVNNPTINQLQGSLANIDPLNIYVGNSNLESSFSNIFKVSYSDIKSSKERELYLKGNISLTANDFAFQSSIDTQGKKQFQYVNINGKKIFTQNITYTRRFQTSNITLNFNGSFKESRYFAFSGPTKYLINNFFQKNTIEILKSKENVYDLGIELSLISSKSIFKIKNLSNISYLTYSLTPSLNLFFPKKIKFHSELAANFYKKNILLESNIISPVLNAYISKSFSKKNNFEFKLLVNDILNKNIGISTESNSTFTSQSVYNVIKRYGLVSILWYFKQNKKL